MRHCFEQFKNTSIRHKIWILTVLLILILVSSWGTFAAYVSRSYVKGVATTPKKDFALSSDYLAVVPSNSDPKTYPDKKILLTEKEETDTSPYTFTFSIMNAVNGAVSTKRIQYYLNISDLPNGATVLYGEDDITSVGQEGYKAPVMKAYTNITHVYTVTIPKDKMTSAADIYVTATPDADSDSSGFILAGRLQPSIIGEVAVFSYSGAFLDAGNIEDYAAFNYQISVSNAVEDHLMKLTWKHDLIEIDPLFLKKIKAVSGNSGELTLTMNDTNSNYLIQFYRLPGQNIGDWDDLIGFMPAD